MGFSVMPRRGDPHPGEPVLRGANVATGHWFRAEADAETITPRGAAAGEVVAGGGWLHAGGIVRADAAVLTVADDVVGEEEV
ncbi:hypothetical protein ACH4UR_36675 [Streptomyces lydicus]|uniref:hypothetical protein n=1 Tax=Streptomyces lydicus TaxID=47763 RepID=UPI003400CB02